jgi:Cd2+/Zn2+-exporting ATPase
MNIQSRYVVSGMDCAACATKVETAIKRLPGVTEVTVSANTGSLALQHEPGTAPESEIARVLKHLGYGLNTCSPDATDAPNITARGHWLLTGKGLLTIACGVALALSFAVGKLLPQTEPWIYLVALAVGLVPIARRAVAAAFAGTPFSIEMLMTIASVGAVAIGATEEAATVVLLFLVGELLEGAAAARARASIQSLAALVPDIALVESGGQLVETPASQLAVSTVIVVRPGDRIAADGTIVEGSSDVNEAAVTGESVAVRKSVGTQVLAGTMNTDGLLRVKVTAPTANNTISRIIRLVEEAQEGKAPTQRFIDRFSSYYTPAVVVAAALVAVVPPLAFGGLWNQWIYKGLAILLIGCPCALVISTPAAVAAALSAGARRGLLMKGGAALEIVGKVTAVAFDKTGTLTEGRPEVTDVISVSRSQSEIISLAAALETGSSHPLAVAILGKAKADRTPIPPASDARAIGGKGITGKVGGASIFLGSPSAAREYAPESASQDESVLELNKAGKTVSVLVAEHRVAGLIAMRDQPRKDAVEGLAALKHLGIRTIMLTGDNQRTGEAIGGQLGIEVRAGLLPEDKQRIVIDLKKEGEIVAKVGDGINDAPALAAADIGIAMGGGTDVALDTADAAILHGRVTDVARMVMLSRAAMSNIYQNVTVALGLKGAFLITTVLGITGLWPAILADTGATVLVTLNALRLLTWRQDPVS